MKRKNGDITSYDVRNAKSISLIDNRARGQLNYISSLKRRAEKEPRQTCLRQNVLGAACLVSHTYKTPQAQYLDFQKRKMLNGIQTAGDQIQDNLKPRSKAKDARLSTICENTVTKVGNNIGGISNLDVHPHVKVLSGTSIRFALHHDKYITLGSGSHGTVYAAYAALNGNQEIPVAIKLFRKDAQTVKDVFREAMLMIQASQAGAPVPHCHGVVPLEIAIDCKFLKSGMVMELININENSTAFQVSSFCELIKTHLFAVKNPDTCKFKPLNKLEWYQFVIDLALALNAVHNSGVVLNDFKTENVVVQKDLHGTWKPYIVDFGLARPEYSEVGMERFYTAADRMTSLAASVAPELFVAGSLCSRTTDTFSLGWLLGYLGTYLKMRLISYVGYACAAVDPMERITLMQLKRHLRKGKAMMRSVKYTLNH